MKKILCILAMPLLLPHVLAFINNRGDEDVMRFKSCLHIDISNKIFLFCYLILYVPEFRNLFYYRIGRNKSLLLNLIFRKESTLYIKTKEIGEGLFIQHGFSTIIYAKKIGRHCWINQQVTIGHSGKGIPTIGNNVSIGAGAIVIGPITVGDNVRIGAGAIVCMNVPDNATVVGEKAHILKS